MITGNITRFIAITATSMPRDSYEAAIKYWVNLGRYTGFRASELCQDSLIQYKRIEDVKGKPCRAMAMGDFTFLDKNESRIHDMSNLKRG